MARIHPPHYQSVSEYREIGSFRVVEQNINPHGEVAVTAIDHCAQWRLFIKALVLIFAMAVLFGVIAFVGIAWDAHYGKDEIKLKDTEELEQLLSRLSLFPPTKVDAT
ncbi:unnamed protein product [Caenorhabditis brenneri]